MKILFNISIAVIIMATMACEEIKFGNEFLEKEPSVDVSIDTIFSTSEYAQRFLWKAYTTLPYGLNLNWGNRNKLGMDVLESLSDLSHSYLGWGGVNQLYYSGAYNAGVENTETRTKYTYSDGLNWVGIRNAHVFIENVDRVPDMSEALKKQLKAEARMVIAVHYTEMFRHYGGMPWVNRSYRPTDDTRLPRLTARATMDSLVALIDKAIPDLPWQIEDLNNWEGRFTQAAAMGLKARVLLFGASPLFNDDVPYLEGEAADKKMVWYGAKDASLWQKTADAAKAMIDKVESNGGYTLVNTGNPRQDFQNAYYARGTGETLISTRVRFRAPGYWDGNYYFFQSAGGYGTANATHSYVDMFPMANGLPITDPASGYDENDPYANRDPRLYETILVNGDAYQSRTAELWIGGRERRQITNNPQTGYQVRKFLLDRNQKAPNSIVHWPYLRLPEVYLTYAEAVNEANGGPTADAYKYVNIVRNRVGLPDLPTGLSKEEFREAVILERALEFGYEEVRWFDLIRWKRVSDFTKDLFGMNVYRENGSFRYEKFMLPERYWKNNWSNKWFLSAFPPDEINKEYGLVQNPGW